MNKVFDQIDRFFQSIPDNVPYGYVFVTIVALFLITLVAVIIITSKCYEAKLIKSIDMFNNYFINTPQIDENNLVAFNNKMESNKVPKQLRKQWQSYVLYREGRASDYMSFDVCVSSPLKNSSFKRAVSTMNIITFILAAISVLLTAYYSQYAKILSKIILAPVLILVVNFIATIFLNLRHNAIVSDLYQNYQYFEVNIDKATRTLPEYVDYEVLFDKQEIKRGIPILYAYLQKRAEDEQRELERARLKNVEHEKFNFDEAGIESSLVLERAMQEAENYLAERKKHMEDIAQINNEITQEELNFREITKEYQRQLQVSKESFNNFRDQLKEVSSTIEANYLKKQQQQELDRQRNLERDYDIQSDKHKSTLDSYQEALTSVENSLKEVRQTLEKAMMSEFSSYSNKVYESAYAQIDEQEKEKLTNLNNSIAELQAKVDEQAKLIAGQTEQIDKLTSENASLVQSNAEQYAQNADLYTQNAEQYPQNSEQYAQSAEEYNNQYVNPIQQYTEQPEYAAAEQYPPVQSAEDLGYTFNYEPERQPVEVENVTTQPAEEPVATQKPTRRGRPRKEKPIKQVKKSAGRGRPKKQVNETENSEPKTTARRGRPKKQVDQTETQPKKPAKRGRPKKQADQQAAKSTEQVKKNIGRGRPKKQAEQVNEKPVKLTKASKKEKAAKQTQTSQKEEPVKSTQTAEKEKLSKSTKPSPKAKSAKQAKKSTAKQTKNAKQKREAALVAANETSIENIDEYLNEINNQIIRENQKYEASKRQLEKNAKQISTRMKKK